MSVQSTIFKIMREVADVLREYQNENSLTQHQMAKYLGIAQSTYNNWINEQTRVNPAKYYDKIALLCQIDTEMILPKSVILGDRIEKNQDIKSWQSALEFCQKYSKNLEEMNESLREQNERLKRELFDKESIILFLKSVQ